MSGQKRPGMWQGKRELVCVRPKETCMSGQKRTSVCQAKRDLVCVRAKETWYVSGQDICMF